MMNAKYFTTLVLLGVLSHITSARNPRMLTNLQGSRHNTNDTVIQNQTIVRAINQLLPDLPSTIVGPQEFNNDLPILRSPSGNVVLYFQDDANLVIVQTSDGSIRWSSDRRQLNNKAGEPVSVSTYSKTCYWETVGTFIDTYHYDVCYSPQLRLQEDGNLVVYCTW